MVSREQIEKYFGEEADVESSFGTENIDYKVAAINLLREKIPYKNCSRIIQGAEHDIIYLVDVEVAMPHLSEDDLKRLNDYNIIVDDETDSFALFA